MKDREVYFKTLEQLNLLENNITKNVDELKFYKRFLLISLLFLIVNIFFIFFTVNWLLILVIIPIKNILSNSIHEYKIRKENLEIGILKLDKILDLVIVNEDLNPNDKLNLMMTISKIMINSK